MHMVIDIGGYQHGAWYSNGVRMEGPPCDTPGPHDGHLHIRIWNGAQPFWQRRPPWASLEFDRKPPKSATETLRWAVAVLAEQLVGPPRPVFNDEDWDVVPAYEHPF